LAGVSADKPPTAGSALSNKETHKSEEPDFTKMKNYTDEEITFEEFLA